VPITDVVFVWAGTYVESDESSRIESLGSFVADRTDDARP
jgi:hypothetical protein